MDMLSIYLKKYMQNYRGIPAICWQKIILSFINATSGGVSFFLAFYYVNVLHMNIKMAGLVVSFYGVGTVLGGIVGGKLIDKISPQIVTLGSLLFKGFLFLALLKAREFFFLILISLGLGLSTYTFIAANSFLVHRLCDAGYIERLKAVNLLYAASNIGLGVAAIIVGVFSNDGFNCIFLFSGGFLLLAFIYQVMNNKAVKTTFPASQEISVSELLQEKNGNKDKKISSLAFLALVCILGGGLILSQLGVTYTNYLKQQFPEMGVTASSYLFIINALLIITLQVPLVGLFNNANKVLAMGIGAGLLGGGMFILNFAVNYPIAILSCITYTIGEMLLIAMAQVICYEAGVMKKKGQNIGLYQASYATGVVIGPILGGYLYQHLGSQVVWSVCGLIGFLSFSVCYYGYRQRERID